MKLFFEDLYKLKIQDIDHFLKYSSQEELDSYLQEVDEMRRGIIENRMAWIKKTDMYEIRYELQRMIDLVNTCLRSDDPKVTSPRKFSRNLQHFLDAQKQWEDQIFHLTEMYMAIITAQCKYKQEKSKSA